MSISIGLLSFLQASFATEAKTSAYTLVTNESQFILARIHNRVEAASAINIPSLGTSTSSLTLTMPTAAEDPTTFTLTNGTITMTRGNGSPIPISSDNIQITNLTFLHLSGTPDQVRVTITGVSRTNMHPQLASVTTTNTFTIPR